MLLKDLELRLKIRHEDFLKKQRDWIRSRESLALFHTTEYLDFWKETFPYKRLNKKLLRLLSQLRIPIFPPTGSYWIWQRCQMDESELLRQTLIFFSKPVILHYRVAVPLAYRTPCVMMNLKESFICMAV